MLEPLITLVDETPSSNPQLIERLWTLYGGDLSLSGPADADRAYCYANLVAALDGIVSFNLPKSETGNEVSGGSEIDHVVMGILRSLADAVIWGSQTYRAARRFVPTPVAIWSPGADLFREQRARLGKGTAPIAVIVTQSGTIPLDGAALRQPDQPAIIATTERGAAHIGTLADALPNTDVWVFGDAVTPTALLQRLRAECGVMTALHEGGSVLLGAFLADHTLDELFLTRAPQFIGRSDAQPRPGLVEGVAFAPDTAPWARLLSLKRSGSYLFTRYALQPHKAGK